jgi:hypothetical protein
VVKNSSWYNGICFFFLFFSELNMLWKVWWTWWIRRVYFLCSSTTAIFLISTELPTLVHAIGDSQPRHTINQYLVTALILLDFMVHNLTAQRDQTIPCFSRKSLEYMGLQELSDMEYSKLVYTMKELFCFQPVFERPQPKSSKRSRAWGG